MMAKRKITANEVLADLKAGFDDVAFMNKYQLSAEGLQSLFNKMINSGAITPTELEDRITPLEKTIELGLFFCTACGNTETKEFTTCPRCGFTPPGHSRQRTGGSGAGKKTSQGSKRATGASASRSDEGLRAQADTLSAGLKDVLESDFPGSVADELPHLEQISRYSQYLAVAAVVAYALVIIALTALMWLFKPGDSISVVHVLLGALALGIPSAVVAFVVVLTLRALALSVKIFHQLVAASQRNNR
jgi:hypothetical protein